VFYNNLDGYAFELIEPNQGANHYGEIEHYKFFNNGTGFYLFESWHDPMDCDDPDCNLEAHTDTATFTYKIISHNRIVFKKRKPMYDKPSIITIDNYNQQVVVNEEDYPLQLQEESVNWNEVEKILEK